MVKFISRLGGLFGANKKTPKKADPKPQKKQANPLILPTKKNVKHPTTHSKPVAKLKPISGKPASTSVGTHAIQKHAATLQKKPAATAKLKPAASDEHLRSLVLFVTPTCPDCASARKLVGDVRRIAHKTILREVDLSTKDGELEGLLNGVVQSPSFMINGRLVFRGVLPARDQLLRVITEGALA